MEIFFIAYTYVYIYTIILKDIIMLKLLFCVLLGLSLFSLTGCGEKGNKNTGSMTKCESGKCDSAMEKSEVPAQKCNADAKDGDK